MEGVQHLSVCSSKYRLLVTVLNYQDGTFFIFIKFSFSIQYMLVYKIFPGP